MQQPEAGEMSVRVMADVWDNGPEDPTQRQVLLYLANCCDDTGGNCFPSIATIAEKTKFSGRTIQRALMELQKGDFVSVIRGTGRGNISQYKINVSRLKGCHRVAKERVSLSPEKGDSGSTKGRHSVVSPTPPYRSNRQEPSLNPQSAGGNGEFMAAGWIMQELGLAGGSYDTQIIAQVIMYAAREAKTDAQTASTFLLQAAQAAIKRGERVNTFWFKDQKFKEEPNNGKVIPGTTASRPSPASERVHANRLAIAKAAVARGWISPDDFDRKDSEAVPEPRPVRNVTGVPSGSGAVGGEVLPPER